MDFVMRFEISLLVETPTTDGAAVWFLSRVDQLVPLQFVGVREFFATHWTVVLYLLFGLFQELRRYFYWNTNHLSARALLPYVGKSRWNDKVRLFISCLQSELVDFQYITYQPDSVLIAFVCCNNFCKLALFFTKSRSEGIIFLLGAKPECWARCRSVCS